MDIFNTSHSIALTFTFKNTVQEHSTRFIIILEENIGIVLDDFGVGDHFLNSDTKTTNYKRRNKLNFFRINNSVF